jgi:hypothetical protein
MMQPAAGQAAKGLDTLKGYGFTGCGKRLDFRRIGSNGIEQGLNPIDFIGLIGILRLRSGQARSRALLQGPRNGLFCNMQSPRRLCGICG